MTISSKTITLAHGNGGQLMQELIKQKIIPAIEGDTDLTDGAVITVNGQEMVFSTDSFTVKPLFFPGGDIGSLAVNGTINDLAAMGAQALYLSCAAIIEEGFSLETLERILRSMHEAAASQEVRIVTGDTKVVEKGSADGLFINTAGLGVRRYPIGKRFGHIRAGDEVIVSGSIGDHGAAIALARNPLGLASEIRSDCTALGKLVAEILQEGIELVFMRDPTRGGVATVLNEILDGSNLGLDVFEDRLSIRPEVKAVCEILGYDPLYLANEGKMIFVVEASSAARLVRFLQNHPLGRSASIIGEVVSDHPQKVVLKTSIGGSRVLDMLVYDQLPRIC